MKGRNGVCWPSGEQLPVRMKACSLPMRWRNSCSRRDLPMPGSATTSMTRSSPRASAKRALENVQFALAPDIGAEAAPHRRIEPRRALADGIEPIDLLRLGLALDRMGAGEGRLDQPLHEALRRFAQIDGSRLGQGLQSRGEVHRVAERRHGGAFAANLRDDRESGIDADAHLRPHAMLGFDRGGGGGEPFVDQQCPRGRPAAARPPAPRARRTAP